jgi:hypothetical protein
MVTENKKETTTKPQYANQKFSFTLYTNENILCKRYFSIESDTYGEYNKNVLKSFELKELMDELTGLNNGYGKMGIIPSFLKKLCENVTWGNYNPYNPYTNPNETKNVYEDSHNYTFEIAVYDKVVVKSVFTGNVFHPYARTGLHIGKIIPKVIDTISRTFTLKNVTTKYETVKL